MSDEGAANSVHAKDVYGVAGDNRGTIIQNFVSQEAEVKIQSRPLIKGSPYLGLEKFAPDDKDKFFGREQWITALSHALLAENHNVLLLLGASGSGKSSLIGAGLIPKLKDDWGAFKNLTFVPDENPFQSLHSCLSSLYGQAKAKIAQPDAQMHKAGTLVRVVEALKQEQQWLIFIDQFEELFTRTPETERHRFVRELVQLIQASQQDNSLKIVLTMRADFLDRLSPYPALGLLHDRRSRMLTDMSDGELTLAIKEPAARNGVVFEPGLIEAIIADYRAGAGSLPLLQYTLDLLWQNDDVSDRVLNRQTYENLGGVTGALQTQANKIYGELDEKQQEAVKKIFFELIDLANDQPVSRRTPKALFCDGGTQQTVLETLIEKRLLVSRGEGQQATIEVAHEALLRTWEVLQQLIQDRKDIIILRGQLIADAKLWRARRAESEQTARGDLWSGWKLDRVLDLQTKQVLDRLDPDIQAFVEASHTWRDHQAQKDRQIARRITVGSSIFAGLMATAAIFSAIQARQAEIEQIQTFVALSTAKLANDQTLEAGIESIRAGKALQRSFWQQSFWSAFLPDSRLRLPVLRQLQQMANTGQERQRLEGHQGLVSRVLFSPDGQQLATSGYDGTARLWDTNGKPLATLQGHQGPVLNVVFSPDGKQLATSGVDGTARLWDTNGKPLATLQGHQGFVSSVVFSPDGQQLATSGYDGTARLWDTNGQPLATLKGHQGRVSSVVFSPDGQQLATSGDDGTARLWDTNGKPIAALKAHQGFVSSVVFSPDGQQLATSGEDGTTRLWDTNGQPIATLQGHQGTVWSVVFSPDGQQLATSGADGTARLWDTNGQPIATLQGHQGLVDSVVFSPDGQQLATHGEDGTTRLWNTNGQPIAALKGQQGRVSSVVFSPDGQQLATHGEDGTPRLWDTNGQPIAALKGHQGRVSSVLFSPDGQQLATSGEDGTARLWDTNGKPIATLKGHQGRVSSVLFSPDGQQLATSGEDGTARLWDTNGKPIATLQGHQGLVDSVVFSPDGQQLATHGEDGTPRLWQVGAIDELLSKECDWVRDYLKNSPNVAEGDRHLCDGIGSQK
ncbi:WD40 repeat domain-containing protein [Leptolyngbya sp. FACHB-321]|uniref:WD40 repeat domain-containing protein n=1 Tax=Leptolyngbya sp. FACHB-321 TaxID=2692807 RepID=UPI001687DFB5|nr:WD40 repeat domain-containing protein [Leptolyngbya sp. FACHB-321]MBD2038277.1 WD40 repeat domain-containing protein [Leptolyngbya sp. FACHB-321]